MKLIKYLIALFLFLTLEVMIYCYYESFEDSYKHGYWESVLMILAPIFIFVAFAIYLFKHIDDFMDY